MKCTLCGSITQTEMCSFCSKIEFVILEDCVSCEKPMKVSMERFKKQGNYCSSCVHKANMKARPDNYEYLYNKPLREYILVD